jgi:aryl-alcohol dehydrogenase-like predicted oxidoreductase
MGTKKFDALARAAWNRGMRLFDTAELYGTHQHLARALAKARRDQYVLVSKVWLQREGLPGGEPEPAGEAVLRFLKELKTDYVDIVLLHGVTDEDWPKLYGDQMEDLAKLRKKGVIRAHGVAAHSLAALRTAAAQEWVQTVHARINPFGVATDDKPDKVVPALKNLHAAGKGVIAMKVLGAGKFAADAKKRQASIRYVLGLDCVDAMVVGFETPVHVDSFAAGVRAVTRR